MRNSEKNIAAKLRLVLRSGPTPRSWFPQSVVLRGTSERETPCENDFPAFHVRAIANLPSSCSPMDETCEVKRGNRAGEFECGRQIPGL